MKLLFASDIHGSAICCDSLLKAYEREQAEKLILLGDILYHGPRNDLPEGYSPKETIKMLNPLKNEIICVRGNCDTEVDQMVLSFPIMSDYAVIFADGHEIWLSHGHIYNPENLPPLNAGAVLINGHTHIPGALLKDGIHCINTGSVSLPKNGNPRSYVIYENETFVIKTLEGEVILSYGVKEK